MIAAFSFILALKLVWCVYIKQWLARSPLAKRGGGDKLLLRTFRQSQFALMHAIYEENYKNPLLINNRLIERANCQGPSDIKGSHIYNINL